MAFSAKTLAFCLICLVLSGWASGCTKDDGPVGLSDRSTTNRFSIRTEQPPFSPSGGQPLPDVSIRVQFRDMQHTDPNDGGYLLVATASGVTGWDGTWSCSVTYKETGSYAADLVLIWATHPAFRPVYETRLLNQDGSATAVLQMTPQ